MASFETADKELPQHEIGSAQVTSVTERVFLGEVFAWLLDPTHLPMTQKESDTPMRRAKKNRKRQYLRKCKAILERVNELRREFPDEKTWIDVSETISARIDGLSEEMTRVTYAARDGSSWYMSKGIMPAIGPRLLLAVCIAQELWPERSPYQAVVEQMGQAADPNRDAIDSRTRAIRKRALDVLKRPNRYPVYGSPRATDPCVLLRHELFDFKCWKDKQQERPDQTMEEFDAQFNQYLDRIHPTAAEEKLLRRLLDKFVKETEKRSKKAKGKQRGH